MGNILAYIDWVWSLQQREAERLDPNIQWQADLSWKDISAHLGWSARALKRTLSLQPGQLTGNTDLDTCLYWPGTRPPTAPDD